MTPFLVAALSLCLGAARYAPARTHTKTGPQVSIVNFRFSPQTVTVPVGTQVTWLNHDEEAHTVVSTGNRFKSPVLDTDQKFTYTFTTKGKFGYFCSIHPMMTGSVTVR